jgi:pimeloyl-ACP methyl ester carboxylesterase
VIHGLASCSSDWVEFLKLAQYKFGRILAVDIPGHGESPFPPKYAGTDPTCEFKWLISAIMESVLATTSRYEEITLVGNSMGGGIAAKLASTIPTRFAHLVLISPAGYPCGDTEKERVTDLFTPKTFTECCALVDCLNFRPIPRALNLTSGFILKERVSSQAVRTLCESIRELQGDFVFVKPAELEMITAKTLLIWGTDDRILPVKHATHFKHIRNLKAELWSDTGHCPQTESPMRVVSRISEFVAENELEESAE